MGGGVVFGGQETDLRECTSKSSYNSLFTCEYSYDQWELLLTLSVVLTVILYKMLNILDKSCIW